MQHGVLVPLDGSRQAECALPIARILAEHMSVPLHLVHVQEPFVPAASGCFPKEVNMSVTDVDAERRTMQQAYLARLQEPLQVVLHSPVTRALCDGPVVEALMTYAEDYAIDLIVMTTHGDGPLVRFWLGSVAEGILRQATIPLLLVRPHPEGERPTPFASFQHALVPLEGSDRADDVIATALDLVDDMATLTLIRVVTPPHLVGQVMRRDAATLEHQEMQRRCKTASDELTTTAARIYPAGKHIEARIITAKHQAVALLEEARTTHCDLIVLSPQDWRLVDSIADKLLRISECPVLIVPQRHYVSLPNNQPRCDINTWNDADHRFPRRVAW